MSSPKTTPLPPPAAQMTCCSAGDGSSRGNGLASAAPEARAAQDDVVSPGFLLRTGRVVDYLVLMGGIGTCWLGVTAPQPYLNPWAQAHGVSAAQAGVLFAAQPFAVVLVQPLVPCLSRRLGEDRLLAAGLLLSSASLVCFAITPALRLGEGLPLFAALCVAAWLAGVGEGVVETSTYTILQKRFPDVVSQVTGHAEAWCGIGTMVGPVLGGSLFSVGGFTLPPAVISGLLFCLALITLVWSRSLRSRRRVPRGRVAARAAAAQDGQRTGSTALELGGCAAEQRAHLEPSLGDADGEREEEEHQGEDDVLGDEQPHRADTLVFVLATGGISLAGFIGGSCAPLMSSYYVNDFGWSEASVGAIFGAYGVFYMFMSVLAGIVADKGPRIARFVYTCGALISGTGMVVSGQELPALSVAGVLALGLADAFLLVPGLGLLMQSTPRRSSSFTASMLNGAYAFGLGLGPLLAVPLSDSVGVHTATLCLGLAAATYAATVAVAFWFRPCPVAPDAGANGANSSANSGAGNCAGGDDAVV